MIALASGLSLSCLLALAGYLRHKKVLSTLLVASGLSGVSLAAFLISIGIGHDVISEEAFLIPAVLSCCMLIASLLQFVKELRTDSSQPKASQIQTLLLILLCCALYLYTLPMIGYYLNTFAFMLVASLVLGNRKILSVASLSLGWLAFAYLVFEKTLQVPLPAGSIVGG